MTRQRAVKRVFGLVALFEGVGCLDPSDRIPTLTRLSGRRPWFGVCLMVLGGVHLRGACRDFRHLTNNRSPTIP